MRKLDDRLDEIFKSESSKKTEFLYEEIHRLKLIDRDYVISNVGVGLPELWEQLIRTTNDRYQKYLIDFDMVSFTSET